MYSTQNTKMASKSRLLTVCLACWAFLLCPGVLAQSIPSLYGRVVLDKYSSKAGLAPVVFDHWLHRSQFTCRLCHVDIGFAMQAQATGIRASNNQQGFYCGSCHDGKHSFGGEVLFAACSDSAPNKQCARCHSADNAARKRNFDAYTAKFPKNAYGIDWEEAEATGLIKPADTLEGVTIKKPALPSPADFSIQARVTWASDIVFSHKKHSTWNGCESCHPDIFPSTKKSGTRYTMFHIEAGQYCGVCHGKVAFTIKACSACHKDMTDKDTLKNVVAMPGPQRASGFGGVKFEHKSHVGEHNAQCENCHHTLKDGAPGGATQQACSTCHTKSPKAPVKTGLEAAFHNVGATAGVCIDCHKTENSKNFSNDIEFVRSLLPNRQAAIDIAKAQLVYGKDSEMRELAQEIVHDQQGELDQMQRWLKQHDAASWAPIKCRECHKKEAASE
jgi:c(7)-type cytochrome triheme protein